MMMMMIIIIMRSGGGDDNDDFLVLCNIIFAAVCSDIILVVMGEAFKLHRMILSRSRYFEGLFSGQWAESEEKVVHLQIDNPYVSGEGWVMLALLRLELIVAL